jgi:hypothetical protein
VRCWLVRGRIEIAGAEIGKGRRNGRREERRCAPDFHVAAKAATHKDFLVGE